ncbi:hypothetical protein FQN60_006453 [Etheostoma spectabile]|uniref:Microtubule-associated protein 11 n=1 Tax=Etheostoma spectabile TaxID=54343 RepID=A0A5J5CLP1_9PERO|nr:hypothetical protein FQN60_006453 [Etheostoma spectabile]
MMESQCEYFMYFPAAPISSLSDPAEYTTLPRRKHVYLGEIVQFLLVLRSRNTAVGRDDSSGGLPWKDLAGSLSALASVCVAESRQQRPSEYQADSHSTCSEDDGEEEPEERESGGEKPPDSNRTFKQCSPHLIHNSSARGGRQSGSGPVKAALVLNDQVVFCLTVSLDKLPVNTLKAKLRSPIHTFRQDLNTFKTQVSTIMHVLPPPSVQFQHMAILPNYNLSYLPMMPDGSVLIVDNVCESSRLPSMLSALEEQNFLFQLQLQDTAEEDSSEEIQMLLSLPSRYISSCYALPSIRLDRPRLVMTASCPRAVRPLEPFWVKYTLLNNLQDFLAVRLIWNSDSDRGGQQDPRAHPAVVCQSPLNNLGQCMKGSTLSFTVAFQILRTGLFELSQHMKLKLQFTASVSTPTVEVGSPLRNSPSSVRELLDRQSLGRSQSFSHQPQPRAHHVRSGSAMAHRSITPPAGSPAGRGQHPPPSQSLISLDKIAKRECKVLVLEPVQEAHSRYAAPYDLEKKICLPEAHTSVFGPSVQPPEHPPCALKATRCGRSDGRRSRGTLIGQRGGGVVRDERAQRRYVERLLIENSDYMP